MHTILKSAYLDQHNESHTIVNTHPPVSVFDVTKSLSFERILYFNAFIATIDDSFADTVNSDEAQHTMVHHLTAQLFKHQSKHNGKRLFCCYVIS